MISKRWGLVFTILATSSQVFGGTICFSICNTATTDPTPRVAPDIGSISGTELAIIRHTYPGEPSSISVDGDLYLDYSIFSDNEDLYIRNGTNIAGQLVTIFSYADTPVYPAGSYATYKFGTNNIDFQGSGNWVLFGSSPFNSGTFEATGNLYIGNYSSLASVPLPSSAFLFLSGLFFSYIYRSSHKQQRIKTLKQHAH